MSRRLYAASFLVLTALLLLLSGCTQPVFTRGGTSNSNETGAGLYDRIDGQSRLIYLVPDQQGLLQLATSELPTGQSRILTAVSEGVADFSVSPDGNLIVYTAWNESGGADLWSIAVAGTQPSLMVECPDAACGRVVWSPDQSELIYERHGGSQEGTTPVLWRMDLRSKMTEPLFGDGQEASASASWSPDNQWFSYYSPKTAQTIVTHVSDGRIYAIPNELAQPILWDPDSASFRLPTIRQDGELSLATLVQYDTDSGLARPSLASQRIADREAAWSPDGEWLAITRRDWTDSYPSKTQIWLMRRDGGEAYPVLADTTLQYLSPVWSPDSNFLLFQRYSDSQVFLQPEVWMLDLATGSTELVLPSAGQVVWVP